jgi:hypothetical protein
VAAEVREQFARAVGRGVIDDDDFRLFKVDFAQERAQALKGELDLVEDGDDDGGLDGASRFEACVTFGGGAREEEEVGGAPRVSVRRAGALLHGEGAAEVYAVGLSASGDARGEVVDARGEPQAPDDGREQRALEPQLRRQRKFFAQKVFHSGRKASSQ